jgi:hypothetical protein
LQTLRVLIKRSPPPGRRLLVIGTSSESQVLQNMRLTQAFNFLQHVPALEDNEISGVLGRLPHTLFRWANQRAPAALAPSAHANCRPPCTHRAATTTFQRRCRSCAAR